ncbi:helix-turn-helix transcriptional regulator [Streptomyces sp. R39]|uniref:Helix-turn-helix transcriptional regulator n=1 Tax=Streptomyces sp. R39 TaxID=3238631 RepID=A0AB39R5L9_9ACTN
MDRDWADPALDLDAVAAHAGYSRYHFLRAFKEAYGETPGQYLTHRRVERAQEMLRGANLTVTEICHLVGFSSLGTFSARLKARTGLSPTLEHAQPGGHRVGGPALRERWPPGSIRGGRPWSRPPGSRCTSPRP